MSRGELADNVNIKVRILSVHVTSACLPHCEVWDPHVSPCSQMRQFILNSEIPLSVHHQFYLTLTSKRAAMEKRPHDLPHSALYTKQPIRDNTLDDAQLERRCPLDNGRNAHASRPAHDSAGQLDASPQNFSSRSCSKSTFLR